MIGWINNSVEAFVRERFGDGVWESVVQTAGLGEGGWVSSCPYPDSQTYTLVITAANLLGVTPADALEAYGVYFVEYTTKQGYDKLLQSLGSNIAEFLQNLNNLHLHLLLSFPAMSAPAFKCTEVGAESLELHYYSARPALGPIVIGVLKGLAENYWSMGGKLGVTLLRGRHDGSEDHEVFSVTYPFQATLRDWEHPAPAPRSFTLDASTFYQLFPFHILLDHHCCVVQAGAVLTRLLPDLVPGARLGEHFVLKHPYHPLEFDIITAELNSVFLLKAKASGLELKGQMIPVPLGPQAAAAPALCPGCSHKNDANGGAHGSASGGAKSGAIDSASSGAGGAVPDATADGLLFMGSVRLAGLDDMLTHKLFISDLPKHDLNRDFVMLAEQRQAEAQLKEQYEALSVELKQSNARLTDTTRWLEEERHRSDQLLYQMLPPDAASYLKHGVRMPATEHAEATILFSDICGFTEIAAKCSPLEVCNLLDDLYHQFDTSIEDFPALYKVETIGDAYMVVANVTVPCEAHADQLLEFAVRMHDVASHVRTSVGEPIRVRIGMHTGPVVAGIVGKKMPRFCLFGDSVNTASRMESHGLPGHIHISSACYDCIRAKKRFVIRERGQIVVKSKGSMKTYLIAPAEQQESLLSAMSAPSPRHSLSMPDGTYFTTSISMITGSPAPWSPPVDRSRLLRNVGSSFRTTPGAPTAERSTAGTLLQTVGSSTPPRGSPAHTRPPPRAASTPLRAFPPGTPAVAGCPFGGAAAAAAAAATAAEEPSGGASPLGVPTSETSDSSFAGDRRSQSSAFSGARTSVSGRLSMTGRLSVSGAPP